MKQPAKSKGYLGNLNLKRPGEMLEWSAPMIEEYKKCRDDILYFADNYFKIVHVDYGKVNITLFPYQRKVLAQLQAKRFNIILQSRQSGKTTAITVFYLWQILFHSDKTMGVLANKGSLAKEILDRIKLAYENLPKWLQQGVMTWNKTSIELENGCRIITGATSSSAARGYSFSVLYIDEAAFIARNVWEDFYKATYPTISSGKETRLILTSSANGLNHFYKLWEDAKSGKSDFAPFEVQWYDVPGRDEHWKLQTIANTSEESFEQEHCNVFLGGVDTLISIRYIKEMPSLDPIENSEIGLKIYKRPEEGARYFVCADVSEGVGRDYHAVSVIRTDKLPYEHVAVFRNNDMSPYVQLPNLIANLARGYNDAYILIEHASLGPEVAQILVNDLEVETVLQCQTRGKKGQQLSFGSNKSYYGLKMTSSAKRLGCSVIKDLIHNKHFQTFDFDTIYEMTKFVRKGTSFAAEKGETDDIIMSLVGFAWLTTQTLFKEMNETSRAKLYENAINQIQQNLVPLGFKSAPDAIETPQPKHVSKWDLKYDPSTSIVDKDEGVVWVLVQ